MPTTQPPSPQAFDLIIIGGGMTGATLSAALAGSSFRIALLEAVPFENDAHVSFDQRTVALTYSSRLILEGLGLWCDIASADIWPILTISVSRRGQPGVTHLGFRDAGTSALGYVIAHRALGSVLQTRIATASNVHIFCPATAHAMHIGAHATEVTLSTGNDGACDDAHQCITAPLVVIADGGRSQLLAHSTLQRKAYKYPQQAVVTMVQSDIPHGGRAWEKFTSSGPLALLPVQQNKYAVAWSLEKQQAMEVVALGDDAFLTGLQRAFGYRTGTFSAPQSRRVYPLQLAVCTPQAQARLALIGNAAHTVHPVAGQGFNLALRDVAELCCILHEARARGEDFGSRTVMQRYAQVRRADSEAVVRFTDTLLSFFSGDWPPWAMTCSAGLSFLNLAPPLKRAILRRSMGLASGQLWMRDLHITHKNIGRP